MIKNRDDAFTALMQIALTDRPNYFTLKDGDFHFLGWRLPAWLVLALSEDLEGYREWMDVEDETSKAAA